MSLLWVFTQGMTGRKFFVLPAIVKHHHLYVSEERQNHLIHLAWYRDISDSLFSKEFKRSFRLKNLIFKRKSCGYQNIASLDQDGVCIFHGTLRKGLNGQELGKWITNTSINFGKATPEVVICRTPHVNHWLAAWIQCRSISTAYHWNLISESDVVIEFWLVRRSCVPSSPAHNIQPRWFKSGKNLS